MKKKITDIWKFLTYDIWRITEDEVTRTKFSLYNIIKTIYLCINRFTKDRMANKASALTYSTLLAIVPILAILFAVARGFGFDNLMEHQFRNGYRSHSLFCQFLSLTNQRRCFHRSRFSDVVMDGHQSGQQY